MILFLFYFFIQNNYNMGNTVSYYLYQIGNTLSYNIYSKKNIFTQQYLDNQNYDNSYYFKDVYLLYIYIDPNLPQNIKHNYIEKMNKHNEKIDQFLDLHRNNSVFSKNINNIDMNLYCFDAGFDLFNIDDIDIDYQFIQNNHTIIIDHKIICAMKFNNYYVSYYLYSRSSTATKTPLRLANSVGIIDSGYRGTIKAAFDFNLAYFNNNNNNNKYSIQSNSRYVQITPPDLSNFPMRVIIVDDINELGGNTSRGDLGFGSTGQ